MAMRDITLSELERTQRITSQADETLQMDQDTFSALYERTARPLWVFLWRRTGDSGLADDLLQETYYRFLRSQNTFESEAHRRNFLFRIATNLAHDSHRQQRQGVHVPLVDDHQTGFPAPDPNDGELSHRRTDLTRAMAQLKPRQRDALWLAYAEGSSHDEIAGILGIKPGSVKLLLFRARRKLAQMLRNGRITP
jgi:RNA polymerase sigma-70 factor (ECF subfamily)